MVLNTWKCNYLTPLRFKGLINSYTCYISYNTEREHAGLYNACLGLFTVRASICR